MPLNSGDGRGRSPEGRKSLRGGRTEAHAFRGEHCQQPCDPPQRPNNGRIGLCLTPYWRRRITIIDAVAAMQTPFSAMASPERDCAARGALPRANVNDIFDVFATARFVSGRPPAVTPHGGSQIAGFWVLPIATKLM
jgi:hypothetical protein